MKKRSKQITITQNDLKNVLDAARVARPLPETALNDLWCFHQYAEQQFTNGSPQSKVITDYLLLDWLNQEICGELAYQRQHFNLPMPDPNLPRETALAHLESDFRQFSPELEAWSVLYFRYVRVDLALSWPQIEMVTIQNERTLRRRQQRGLSRLTSALVAAEVKHVRRQSA